MIYPLREEFVEKARFANLIPVYKEIIADLETPITIFQKVCKTGPSYLLESGEIGEKFGRYSFIGCKPFAEFKNIEGRNLVILPWGITEEINRENPLGALREILKKFIPAEDKGLPRFYGGAVGYAGYDVIQHIEDVPLPEDDLGLPVLSFIFAGLVLIYDHWRHSLKIVKNVWVRDDAQNEYQRACEDINCVLEALKKPLPPLKEKEEIPFEEIFFTSNVSRKEYMNQVVKAREYIARGDIFQVVLSQRFEAPLKVDPFSLYRVLRTVNPSPYMYYLDFEDVKVVGSSPEPLVRLEDGVVETRPIAGTRPRGHTAEEDRRLAKDLQSDQKEKAEHIMLVDLARNDLGRICEFGSIEVNNLFSVEKYSHVMHMVTEVKGKLKAGRDAFDVLAACFPAGTVSGAPKIRAMEIISELETCRRGPYAGAVGYFGFSGNMDTCITIRTMVIKDEKIYVQAGAGIVADSQPEKEFQETRHKAAALLKAINLAEEGHYDFSHR